MRNLGEEIENIESLIKVLSIEIPLYPKSKEWKESREILGKTLEQLKLQKRVVDYANNIATGILKHGAPKYDFFRNLGYAADKILAWAKEELIPPKDERADMMNMLLICDGFNNEDVVSFQDLFDRFDRHHKKATGFSVAEDGTVVNPRRE